jgi:hypothetical protein
MTKANCHWENAQWQLQLLCVPWFLGQSNNCRNLTIYIAITIIIFIFMSRCFWSLVKHSTCHTFSGIFADEGFEIFANVHWLVLGLFNYFSMLWSPFISFHIFYLKTLDGLQDLVTKHRLKPPTKFRTKFYQFLLRDFERPTFFKLNK